MSAMLRTVTQDEADIRLDRWFRRHFPAVTQGAIQKYCRTGQVRVDGRRAEASTRLAAGQAVRVPPLPATPAPPPAPPPDEAVRREILSWLLYQDDQVLVLNKPYGLPVQGGPGIRRHLDGMLGALTEGEERPRLVHRLDRDTSGVLLLARSAGVAAKLAAAFRGREMEKTYWAVVTGRPVPPEGRIDLPLIRTGGARGERTAPAGRDNPDATHAITGYRTLDHAARKLAWLELSPLTGRTHQLRVHCAAIGTPILGDGKYGGQAAHIEGLSGQLHLHARALALPHPAGGRLEVAADLPPHMKETFQTIGFTAQRTLPPRRR